MNPLVLSIFPGADMLGMAFEQAGFCVVCGPDVIFGRDIRQFHPPAGVFDGVIGGDPCQSHSTLARLVRAKGYEPKFPDMTADFQRIVEEAKPRWFLRENVPLAPDLAPAGYGVSKLRLRNLWIAGEDGLGQQADRKRCFWFGVCGEPARSLQPFIGDALACLEQPRRLVELTQEPESLAKFSIEPRLQSTAGAAVVSGHGDPSFQGRSAQRAKDGYRVRAMTEPAVTNRHPGAFPTTDQAPSGYQIEAAYAVTGGGGGTPSQRDAGVRTCRMPISEMARLQGLPEDFLADAPFTADGKRQIIANGVPIFMGKAVAKAVWRAMGYGA